MNKKLILALTSLVTLLTACVEIPKSDTNTVRRLTVINTQTNTVEIEITGTIWVYDDTDIIRQKNELIVSVETGPNEYKKHVIKLTNQNKYIIEELEKIPADQYRHEVKYGAKIESTINDTINH